MRPGVMHGCAPAIEIAPHPEGIRAFRRPSPARAARTTPLQCWSGVGILRTSSPYNASESHGDAEDMRAIVLIEKRIAEGRERVYSHEEVWAELETNYLPR